MPTDEPDADPAKGRLSEADRADIKSRARELGEKLDQFRDSRAPKPERGAAGGALGHALRMAVDPVAGVLVGVGIGLLIDGALGTKPLFLLVFLVLGAIAGLMNMVRSAQTKPREPAHGSASDTTTNGTSRPGSGHD